MFKITSSISDLEGIRIKERMLDNLDDVYELEGTITVIADNILETILPNHEIDLIAEGFCHDQVEAEYSYKVLCLARKAKIKNEGFFYFSHREVMTSAKSKWGPNTDTRDAVVFICLEKIREEED